MKAFLGLVSSNALSLSLVQKEQANLFSEQLRKDRRFTAEGATLSVGTYNPATSRETLLDFVYTRSARMDIAALLVEGTPDVELETMSPAILVGRVEFNYAALRMSIEAALNRTLKNLLEIHALTSDEKNLQVLLLPKRNFLAQALDDLLLLGLTSGASHDLMAQLNAQLAELRRHRRPRRKAEVDPRKQYIVDHRKKLFDYGREDHSKFETGATHTKSCILAGRYRLGAKIPFEYRHYNMTMENGSRTWITGNFPDCHGTEKSVNATHVNIFANDYH